MHLSTLLDSIVTQQGVSRLCIPEDWLQGRTAFGGLQGAFALQAMRHCVPPDIPLRAFQMTFLAPVYGGDVIAKAQVLRQGKNTCHVEARLMHNEQTLALAVAVFGWARASAVNLDLQFVELPDTAGSRPFHFLPGITPAFTQHFDAHWRSGGMPFSGHPEPSIVVDVSLRDCAPVTEAHVLALADFVPPVALSLLKNPVPGSSLTWMLEMLGEPLAGLPLANWRIEADMVAACDGYSSQTVTLWSPQRKAIALSRQSMVVFG